MIKRIFLTLLQFCVFLALFAIGGFWALLHLMALGSENALFHLLAAIPVWRTELSSTRSFTSNGVVFASLLLLLILLVEVLRKRIRPWVWLTLLAFGLALLLSFSPYLHFGFQTVT